jgi:dipeptidase E
VSDKQIIAFGGGILQRDEDDTRTERLILDVSGKRDPRVCYIPTASGDSAEYIDYVLTSFRRLGVSTDVLRFFDRTPADLPEFVAQFDIIQVGGGNTRSMLAVWRHWGLDVLLRQAWERGVVLCGSSAGSLCWFESGLTDSVADAYTAMTCLGFLAGSNCVHYNTPDRRAVYLEMVEKDELSAGIACPDGVAAHFVGERLARAVSIVPDHCAYFVEKVDSKAVESRLETTFLKK